MFYLFFILFYFRMQVRLRRMHVKKIAEFLFWSLQPLCCARLLNFFDFFFKLFFGGVCRLCAVPVSRVADERYGGYCRVMFFLFLYTYIHTYYKGSNLCSCLRRRDVYKVFKGPP